MYYGGAGWLGWVLMAFSMIAVATLVIFLVLGAARSFGGNSTIASPPSGALGILQERLARGEISNEEFKQQSQLIRGTA
ncbi:MAG: SHOCT domain-containing protein [Candidatus Dormibacteria bacterium]